MARWRSGRCLPMVPDKNQFPYTIRAVSEVLSSNGSTSMASTCASTLALMDAGVPISAPVAGVAMGLVKEGERYAVLTDIQGMEDNLGDMDFKVTGTSKGITALQMDIKITGISADILRVALEQARVGRLFILDKMLAAIPEPRAELSPYAPRVTILKINPEKIGALIGPGGKNIRGIIEQTGVKIDVEDDGSVFISAIDKESGLKAEAIVPIHDRRRGDRQDLYRQGHAHHGLWRLCADSAQQRGHGAHLAAR